MEDTALKQPTMVSRLPKFGSRAPVVSGPLSNGSALPVSCAGGKGVPVGKQNGVIRVPSSLSAKWKKERDDSGEKNPNGEDPRMGLRSQQQPRSATMVRDFGKPSAAPVGKARRSIPTATSTNLRTIPQSTRANPRTTAPKNPSPNLSTYSRRTGMNGVGSGLPKPGSSSSLSQSSDSLKSVPVEHVVRSQSFSHLKSSTTPANPPLTRSFSFNRAAELAKELPRPLAQSPLARSPVTQPSLVLAGERPGQFGVTVSTNTSCSLPPTALKKSLLPNCSSSKPSAISYKLMRPSLIKQPRTGLSGKVQVKSGLMQSRSEAQETLPPTSDISSNTESAETTPDDSKESNGLQIVSLEIPEDMSLSSTSSLERNDMSEEYMDDFDDLCSGVRIQLLPVHDGGNSQSGFDDNALVSQCQEGSSVTSLHSFLSETVDWAEMGLTGTREGLDVSPHCVSRKMSSGGDLPHGSSLDLSPSDSSGGTYMWDEEVLEPLGGTTHHCGSYDSDLNSMDILNNLENLESCDLEDDDLMLDVDLAEDASLHSDVDGVSLYDRSERGYWPGQWRRRQQRWGRPEQLQNNNRAAVLSSFDDCHLKDLGSRGSGHSSLDELMLKHMAQDCSSVKEQLLQLKRLLQIEEDGSVESEELDYSPSSEETSCQQQVEELLKEVQNLREELREKERLIAKLTQQMAAPLEVPQCHCLQGEPLSQGHQDQSTQTPWRVHNPQILQPSRPSSRSSGHNKLERPPSKVLTGAHNDCVDSKSGDCPVKIQSCASVSTDPTTSNAILTPPVPTTAPASAATVSATVPAGSYVALKDCGPDELHQLLDTHLTISDLHSSRVPTSNMLLRIGDPQSPGVQGSNCIPLQRRDRGPNDLHSLQPLGCTKRATVLMRHREGSQMNLGRGCLGKAGRQPCFTNTSRTRHMPPPSRGLPCISSALQVAAPATLSAHNVHFRSLRPNQAPKDVEHSSAHARDLPQPCNSRLPKPKNH